MSEDVPKLYRLILQVANLDRATAFYTRLLGMEGRRIPGSRVYFDCGPVILAIVSSSEITARPSGDNVYFSVRDLEAIHVRARELGCLAEGDVHDSPAGEIVTRPWGERSFYVVDADKNQLCFVDETTLFTGR